MRPQAPIYNNIYEICKDLNDKEMALFMRAYLDVQFLKVEPDSIKFNDRVLSILWKSIKNSLQTSIDGYINGVKNKQSSPFLGVYEDKEDNKNTPLDTPSHTPLEGGNSKLDNPPADKNKDKEQEQEQYKEKNIKKENSLLKNIPQSKKEIAKDFIAYRKEIKKPIKTSLALTKHLSNLDLCVSQSLGTYESLTQKMKEREWLTIEPSYLQGLHVQKNKQKQDMSDYLQSKGIALNNDYIDTEVMNE